MKNNNNNKKENNNNKKEKENISRLENLSSSFSVQALAENYRGRGYNSGLKEVSWYIPGLPFFQGFCRMI